MFYAKKNPNRINLKAAWLTQFEDYVLILDNKHAGKIDWNTAIHLFNQGMDCKDAANQYVNNRKGA